jgi:hypothetical protein
MQKREGYLQIFLPNEVIERDTFTCNHCGFPYVIEPFGRSEYGYCDICDCRICPNCLKRAYKNGQRCDPWEEQIRRIETRYRFYK